MDLSELEIIVLGWISFDYEAIHTIKGNIESDLSRSVTDAEINDALLRLKALGFAQSFIFDSGSQNYTVSRSPETTDPSELWWLITEAGNSLINKEAEA